MNDEGGFVFPPEARDMFDQIQQAVEAALGESVEEKKVEKSDVWDSIRSTMAWGMDQGIQSGDQTLLGPLVIESENLWRTLAPRSRQKHRRIMMKRRNRNQ
jgi:hypothetical protein